MRKMIAPVVAPSKETATWLDLSQVAAVEVTSEDPNWPIENAFECQSARGWRAAAAGDQQIRIVFDTPARVRRFQLRFSEPAVERTQEFTLRWYDADARAAEIVPQQWNFSPGRSPVDREDYHDDLEGVSAWELAIRPGLNGAAVASLDCWRIA